MKKITISIAFLLASLFAYSQEVTPQNEKQELSVKALNPTAKIYKLILMNNTTMGPQNTNTMYVEPAIPVNLGKKFKLINFAMIPIDTRKSSDGTTTETALGNILYSANFTPTKPIKLGDGFFSPMIGPAVQFNTNTYSELATPSDDSWNLGVNVGGAYKNKGFLAVIGYTPTWGVGGAKEDYTTIQYVLNYSFKSGTGINMSPLLMKNDAFEGDTKWVVPVGLGVSQIIKTKKAIYNVALSGYYNAVRPDVMQDKKFQFQVKFYVMIPSK